MNKQTQTNR